MQDLKMGVANTEEETQAVMKVYSKEDYSVVNRFESMYTVKFYSTGWSGLWNRKLRLTLFLFWFFLQVMEEAGVTQPTR